MKLFVMTLGVVGMVIGLSEGAEITPEQFWMTGTIITWMALLKD